MLNLKRIGSSEQNLLSLYKSLTCVSPFNDLILLHPIDDYLP
jgi:hypothetical protein